MGVRAGRGVRGSGGPTRRSVAASDPVDLMHAERVRGNHEVQSRFYSAAGNFFREQIVVGL
jgi:hypothetical protein